MSGLPRFGFTGSTAVVTGAAGGIGEQVARQLAVRGAHLVLLDRDTERLKTVAAAIRAESPRSRVEPHVVDLADRAALDRVAQDIERDSPRIDLLVNNAGVAMAGYFDQMTIEEFDWVLDVNFHAPVRLTHRLLPALAPGAHVVNLSSVFGLIAPPGQTAYCASKFGLRGWSESLRAELRPQGIGVTTVHPGGIRTGIARSARVASGMPRSDAEDGRDSIDRMLRIPAERAAASILRAVERRQPRLLIGASARIPDVLARAAPAGYAIIFRPVQARVGARTARLKDPSR